MTLGNEGRKTVVSDGIALTDTQILLLTLWGEGRSESVEGRVAIGSVVRNRVIKAGTDSYAAICLARYQFSCWNPEGGQVNYESVMGYARRLAIGDEVNDPIVRECGWIASGVIGGWLRDNTRGATHYLTKALYRSEKPPSWVRGKVPVAEYGEHLFFAGIR